MNAPLSATPATASSARARLQSAAILILKIALAALLIAWLFRSGRLDFSQLSHLHFGVAFFGMMFFQAAMLACIALRWHFIARACGLSFSLKQTLRIGLIGNFAAVWTPAGLGLDGARLVLARALAPDQNARIAASVLCDRLLSVWALACLTMPACAFLLLDHSLLLNENLRRALAVIFFACAVSVVAPLALRGRLIAVLARRFPALTGFSKTRSDAQRNDSRAVWCGAVALALATHLCNFASIWCALRVLGGAASLFQIFLVAPLIVLSSLLPLTPLGLGVTDAAASTLLRAVGIGGGAEAAMLARPTFILLSALCGLTWLWPQNSLPVISTQNDEIETSR